MSFSHQFETENGVYRLFRTTHGLPTREELITPERFQSLDGIVLEVTGDDRLHNPPENVFKISTHEHVIKTAESLGDKSPAIYVVDVHMASAWVFVVQTWVTISPRLMCKRESNPRPFSVWGKCGENDFPQGTRRMGS